MSSAAVVIGALKVKHCSSRTLDWFQEISSMKLIVTLSNLQEMMICTDSLAPKIVVVVGGVTVLDNFQCRGIHYFGY